MSKPQTPEELVQQVTTLLHKHEIYNEVLAVEIAILVTRREKTMIKRSYRNSMHILDKAFRSKPEEVK